MGISLRPSWPASHEDELAAIGLAGKEGETFRKVIGWSIFFVLVMAVFVRLQSTERAVLDGASDQAVAQAAIVRSERSIERGA